ncbi:hypothetical protein ACIPIC_40985 [Streptomyces collinus]|uniref:hypothetical protein n=1 Tax=Streptomyces collinus TaxID=42684 RepID=UPI003801C2BE
MLHRLSADDAQFSMNSFPLLTFSYARLRHLDLHHGKPRLFHVRFARDVSGRWRHHARLHCANTDVEVAQVLLFGKDSGTSP